MNLQKNYIEYYQVKERFRCMKIEHVAMYFNDLEKARDFFVKYFAGKANDGYHNRLSVILYFF